MTDWLNPQAVREWLGRASCPEHGGKCYPASENIAKAWEQFGLALAAQADKGEGVSFKAHEVARIIRDAQEGKWAAS